MSNSEVARKLHITGATVGKWRERFLRLGLEGLLDEPRVGAPRKITDRQIEQVVTRTLESMPANSTHWSTRLMAAETRSIAECHSADLARFRIAAASCGELQVF
jgi:transposase